MWNAKTRAWAKGDPERLKKLEVRSSSRYLRWEGDQAHCPEETVTAIREATRRFEKELRDAREEALQESEEDRRIALFVKNTFGDGIAVPLWIAWQLILGAACLAAAELARGRRAHAAPSAGLGDAAAAVAAGLAAAPALARVAPPPPRAVGRAARRRGRRWPSSSGFWSMLGSARRRCRRRGSGARPSAGGARRRRRPRALRGT